MKTVWNNNLYAENCISKIWVVLWLNINVFFLIMKWHDSNKSIQLCLKKKDFFFLSLQNPNPHTWKWQPLCCTGVIMWPFLNLMTPRCFFVIVSWKTTSSKFWEKAEHQPRFTVRPSLKTWLNRRKWLWLPQEMGRGNPRALTSQAAPWPQDDSQERNERERTGRREGWRLGRPRDIAFWLRSTLTGARHKVKRNKENRAILRKPGFLVLVRGGDDPAAQSSEPPALLLHDNSTHTGSWWEECLLQCQVPDWLTDWPIDWLIHWFITNFLSYGILTDWRTGLVIRGLLVQILTLVQKTYSALVHQLCLFTEGLKAEKRIMA